MGIINNLKKVIIHFCVLIFALFSVVPVWAAVIEVRAPKEININDEFKIFVYLDTEDKEINAVEGKIIFPADLLELKDISEANSIISLWVERPVKEQGTRDKEQEAVRFAGIIPGGYKGKEGLLLILVFNAKKEGEAKIGIQDLKVLLNDGKGTETKTNVKEASILIKEVNKTPTKVFQIDTFPPEPFKPEIGQDPNLFSGRYFLVFQAQDKQTGILRYEIKEAKYKIFAFLKKWDIIESPYILKDQKLKSYIFVKAVDKAGNERIEVLPPRNPLKWYERIEIWIIIVIVVFSIQYIVYSKWNKRQGTRNK